MKINYKNPIWLESPEGFEGKGVISILGPTGSGKTKCALTLAQKFFAKKPLLVSLDSVALYKGLDIGSAKPSSSELNQFEWLGIDLISIDQKISAPDFCRRLQEPLSVALIEQRPVICVGGSHFYEKALIEGSKPGGPTPPEEVQKLESISNQILLQKLLELDSRWGTRVNLNDRYRLQRFYDLALRQKLSFDDLMGDEKTIHYLPPNTSIFRSALGMNFDRDESKKRLSKRIEEMWNAGWVDEVKNLLNQGFPKESPGLQSVGYREVVEFILGELNEKQTLEKILISHLQLAKKQRTWIRGLARN